LIYLVKPIFGAYKIKNDQSTITCMPFHAVNPVNQ